MDLLDIILASDMANDPANKQGLTVINFEDYFVADFFSMFQYGISTHPGKAFLVGIAANSELFAKFTPNKPMVIVKIPVSIPGAGTGCMYAIGSAMFMGDAIMQVHISGSFYYTSLYDFDIHVNGDGSAVLKFVQHEVVDDTTE